ncbi:MAG: hypothetical protein AABY86_02005 [Bdellovibrionota bacterium]
MSKHLFAGLGLTVGTLFFFTGCMHDSCSDPHPNACDGIGAVRGLVELEGYSHDLEMMAGLAEKQEIVALSDNIMAKFGLGETRSLELAKFATQWQRLATTRQMSAGDRNAFEMKVLGTTIFGLEKAYKKSIEGEPADLNRLIESAARLNGISPEHVSKILNELLFN